MCSPYSQAHLEILCVYLYSQVALHLCCSFGWQSVSHTLRTWRASLARALARALPPLSLFLALSLWLACSLSLSHTLARGLSPFLSVVSLALALSLSLSLFFFSFALSLSRSLSRACTLSHTHSLSLFFSVCDLLSRAFYLLVYLSHIHVTPDISLYIGNIGNS